MGEFFLFFLFGFMKKTDNTSMSLEIAIKNKPLEVVKLRSGVIPMPLG